MIGYVYIDIDNEVVYKTQDYIENSNPGFWTQNSHLLARKYKFDTEDVGSMLRVFRAFSDMEVSVSNVRNFCSAIGYDIGRLPRVNKV